MLVFRRILEVLKSLNVVKTENFHNLVVSKNLPRWAVAHVAHA